MNDGEDFDSTSPAGLDPRAAARERRLAEALRVNLRRRKAQTRARKADEDALEAHTVEKSD